MFLSSFCNYFHSFCVSLWVFCFIFSFFKFHTMNNQSVIKENIVIGIKEYLNILTTGSEYFYYTPPYTRWLPAPLRVVHEPPIKTQKKKMTLPAPEQHLESCELLPLLSVCFISHESPHPATEELLCGVTERWETL